MKRGALWGIEGSVGDKRISEKRLFTKLGEGVVMMGGRFVGQNRNRYVWGRKLGQGQFGEQERIGRLG